MEEHNSKVTYEDVKTIFDCFKYWNKDDEYYWYENMWLILDRKGLTSYENDEQYYEIILMSVALVIMVTDYIALKYDECDLHDCFYSNVVSDMISEFNLGALYYKYAKEFDDGSLDFDYVVEYLADIMKNKVYGALVKELGVMTLFLSMEAIDSGLKHKAPDNDEDKECYDEEFEPASANEFWNIFKETEEDIANNIDCNALDIGSTLYGWVESGCPSVL